MTKPVGLAANGAALLRPVADILRDLADVHLRLASARLALDVIATNTDDEDTRALAASAFRNTAPERAAVHHHYPPNPQV